MDLTWLWILLAVLVALSVVFVVPIIVTNVALSKTYKGRCDGSISIKYPTKDLFPKLRVKRGSFLNNKKAEIYTYQYSYDLKKYKAVICYVHGVGAGHTYALPLINFLAEKGYIIYCYDQYACGASEGKKMDSMYQGIWDIKYALKDIEKNPEHKDYPLYVMGHSWGGNCASHATRFSSKVSKIIDIAGMDSEAMMAPHKVMFFVKLRAFLKYGKVGYWTTLDSFSKTSAKVMYLQGNCDVIVNPKYSGLMYKEAFKNKKNICVEMIDNAGHSPFVNKKSQDGQNRVMAIFGLQANKLIEMQPRIDYFNLSKPNDLVCNKIIEFLDD